jgi:hypothetical protein
MQNIIDLKRDWEISVTDIQIGLFHILAETELKVQKFNYM